MTCATQDVHLGRGRKTTVSAARFPGVDTITALPLTVGAPVEHRGIVIAPLFPVADPVADYVTLDEALPRGLAIEEIGAGGTVPELVVDNPLDQRVLLYDGEELVGAKQNRILNVSVLVDAASRVTIPVSCVEEGRWSTRTAFFAAAAHVSNVNVRRRKAELLAARPLARGGAQAGVWDEVRAQATRMHVRSTTGANIDTFDAYREPLDDLDTLFPVVPGQCGAVLGLGDALCLDWVSQPEAFARLWPKLRRGYLLDALEALDGDATDPDRLDAFAASVSGAGRTTGPSPGLGTDVRLRGEGVIGSGLELDGELLQLSAFTSADGGAAAFGRIARPSERR
jgi:hypothetical protein